MAKNKQSLTNNDIEKYMKGEQCNIKTTRQ